MNRADENEDKFDHDPDGTGRQAVSELALFTDGTEHIVARDLEDACRRADGWQRQAEECAAGIVLAVIRQHDAESRSEELEKELQELKDAIDGKTHLRDAARAAEENP